MPFIRSVFTLNDCAPIVGSDVKIYYDEGELLQAWRDFVNEVRSILVRVYIINSQYMLRSIQTWSSAITSATSIFHTCLIELDILE